ncbi:hypothetical protein GCM10027592_31660 [Spirosoma flavus]
MLTYTAVAQFLSRVKVKADQYGLAYLGNNTEPNEDHFEKLILIYKRAVIIQNLAPEDFTEGPKICSTFSQYPSLVFGKSTVEGEISIELSEGIAKAPVFCRAFQWAPKPLIYPLKRNLLV